MWSSRAARWPVRRPLSYCCASNRRCEFSSWRNPPVFAWAAVVGEATVEISGYFLCRVLRLTKYLNESHLVKQGMRFCFTNDHAQKLDDCSEIGGKYLSRVASFQVDRAALDEEVLRRAAELGAEVWRGASAGKIQPNSGGNQTVGS